jgi:phosphoglycolate phosphatase-like HAD superfamily hydrolase
MLRNIIWDVGGTLFDTYPAMTAAFLAALAERGLTAPVEQVRALAQVSQKYCVQVLASQYHLNEEAFMAEYKKFLNASPPQEMPPFPGVIEVCQYIFEKGGKNLIATHRARESVEELLAYYHLQPFFAGCLTTSDGYPRKPDPAMLEALVQQYTLVRAETLAIGDRELDIQAGKAAGLLTCLFGKEPVTTAPDTRIVTYTDLLKTLKSQT